MKTVDIRKHEQLFCHHSRDERPDQSQFIAHVHSEVEVYYLIEGNVEYHVENSVYLLQPGDIMLMRPGEVHYAYVDSNSAYERISLRFPPELIRDTPDSCLLSPFMDRPLGSHNHYHTDQLPAEYIRGCWNRIFAQKQTDSQRRIFAYLLPILQEIFDAWKVRDIPPQMQATTLPARIMAYINDNLLTLKSPQQLAEALYMSQSQLYRVFRTHAGLSAWDYVRVKRMFSAQELMQKGTPPSIAATECGFTEYSTFYRAYIKQFGHPPKDDYIK